jgi:hypothetical protein
MMNRLYNLVQKPQDKLRALLAAAGRGQLLARQESDRIRRLCPSCAAATPHRVETENGLGWYAERWICLRCHQKSAKIIAFGI